MRSLNDNLEFIRNRRKHIFHVAELLQTKYRRTIISTTNNKQMISNCPLYYLKIDLAFAAFSCPLLITDPKLGSSNEMSNVSTTFVDSSAFKSEYKGMHQI